MLSIDEIDRMILNRIQSDFPITTRPYLSIAENLNLSEDQVIKRLKRLKKKGIIRRIGGNFVPEKLGFVSTLSGVTHNYRRDNKYNIWFTFIAQSMDEIKNNLENISQETSVKGIINLPATKMYKIKAHFDL
jgi:DNA-binding Lrp family transcriptional regulator